MLSGKDDEFMRENLRKLLELHWHQCQHLENERAQFMQVYAAIVVGIIVGFGYLTSGLNSGLLALIPLFFLIVLTFFGFFLSLRWTYSFECHRERVKVLARLVWFHCKVDAPLDPTMEILPMRIPLIGRILRTRYISSSFYLAMTFALFILFIVVGWKGWSRADPLGRGLISVASLIVLALLVASIMVAVVGYRSIERVGKESRVVLVGCNSDWAQQRYLPLLIDKANHGDITLWATDIQPEIELNTPGILSLWQAAKSRGRAVYLDMRKSVASHEVPCDIDYVFIVTPDRCHCKVAEFWLSRLSTTGKVFIEKPLDASIQAAEQLKARLSDNNVVYGFDHYLASLYPFLRRQSQYLKKIGGIRSLEIRILEKNEIPPNRVDTLREGVIFDLFSHALAVSAAVVGKKLAPTEDTLRKTERGKWRRVKYRGCPLLEETWAHFELTIENKMVTGVVGKGVGKTDKRMSIYGTSGRKIEIDFEADSFSVNGRVEGKLDSKHVESFLKAVLKGSNIDSAPGVMSFGAAFEILRLLSCIRDKTNMGPDYAIGTDPL